MKEENISLYEDGFCTYQQPTPQPFSDLNSSIKPNRSHAIVDKDYYRLLKVEKNVEIDQKFKESRN